MTIYDPRPTIEAVHSIERIGDEDWAWRVLATVRRTWFEPGSRPRRWRRRVEERKRVDFFGTAEGWRQDGLSFDLPPPDHHLLCFLAGHYQRTGAIPDPLWPKEAEVIWGRAPLRPARETG